MFLFLRAYGLLVALAVALLACCAFIPSRLKLAPARGINRALVISPLGAGAAAFAVSLLGVPMAAAMVLLDDTIVFDDTPIPPELLLPGYVAPMLGAIAWLAAFNGAALATLRRFTWVRLAALGLLAASLAIFMVSVPNAGFAFEAVYSIIESAFAHGPRGS